MELADTVTISAQSLFVMGKLGIPSGMNARFDRRSELSPRLPDSAGVFWSSARQHVMIFTPLESRGGSDAASASPRFVRDASMGLRLCLTRRDRGCRRPL